MQIKIFWSENCLIPVAANLSIDMSENSLIESFLEDSKFSDINFFQLALNPRHHQVAVYFLLLKCRFENRSECFNIVEILVVSHIYSSSSTDSLKLMV